MSSLPTLRQQAAQKISPMVVWQSDLLKTPLGPEARREFLASFTLENFYQNGYLSRQYIQDNFNYDFYRSLLEIQEITNWLWPNILVLVRPIDDVKSFSRTVAELWKVSPLTPVGFQEFLQIFPGLSIWQYQDILKKATENLMLDLATILSNQGVVYQSNSYDMVWDYRHPQYRYLILSTDGLLLPDKKLLNLRDFLADLLDSLILLEIFDNFTGIFESPEEILEEERDFLEQLPEATDIWQKLMGGDYINMLMVDAPLESSIEALPSQERFEAVRMNPSSLVILTKDNTMFYFAGKDAELITRIFGVNPDKFHWEEIRL